MLSVTSNFPSFPGGAGADGGGAGGAPGGGGGFGGGFGSSSPPRSAYITAYAKAPIIAKNKHSFATGDDSSARSPIILFTVE